MTVATSTSTSTKVRELSADELAVLEEERDFLLRSLQDLDTEHEAGDVDETDYEALRDDYTARAARVIRTIEKHQAQVAEAEPRATLWRRVGVVAGIVAFALLAGVLVAQAAGRREAGDSVTGDIRETSRTQIDQAILLAREDRYDEAIALVDDVIAKAPDNVEAMTWKGWFQYLSGDAGSGLSTLLSAAEVDATFPATHAFMATILHEADRPDLARVELERLDALDPPQEILILVEPLRAELDQQAPPAG